MKKIIILLFVMVAAFGGIQAQPAQNGNGLHKRPSIEEFFQKKLDFVIKDLKLSEADSIKFAPMYREYQKAKGDLMRQAGNGRGLWRKMMQKETITDEEFLSAARGELDYKAKDAELTKIWYTKFESVLTPKQLFTLIRSEERFATEMMQHRGKPGEPRHGAPDKTGK